MTVKDILSQALHIPSNRIPDDATRGKLRGWDSVGHVNLILAIEDQFSIQLTNAEILQMSSIPQIATILRGKGVSVEGPAETGVG